MIIVNLYSIVFLNQFLWPRSLPGNRLPCMRERATGKNEKRFHVKERESVPQRFSYSINKYGLEIPAPRHSFDIPPQSVVCISAPRSKLHLYLYTALYSTPALRPTNPYLHPSKNTNTCDSPYNILNSLFWALSQSGKMYVVRRVYPHKKTLVKSTYMRFPIQKVKFAFLTCFPVFRFFFDSRLTILGILSR